MRRIILLSACLLGMLLFAPLDAHAGCWAKQLCTNSFTCQVYVPPSEDRVPYGWYTVRCGLRCLNHEDSGAEGCFQEYSVRYDSDGSPYVCSKADFFLAGCCSVPCPYPYVGCQPDVHE